MQSEGSQEKGLRWDLSGLVNPLSLDASLPYRTPPDISENFKTIYHFHSRFISADLAQDIGLEVERQIVIISSSKIWIGGDGYIFGVTTFGTTFFFLSYVIRVTLLGLSTALLSLKDFKFHILIHTSN